MKPEAPIKLFDNQADMHDWLVKNYDKQEGIWLKVAKKNNPKPSVTYAQAVEEALCFGWIDGQLKGFDDQYFLQKFTPRRAKSVWSKINTQKAQVLIKAGRMMPPGQAQIDAAKKDGRWDAAYESSTNAEIPEDFLTALDNNPKAKAFFDTLNKVNLYAIYFRLHHTKDSDLRAKKIATFIAMLAEGKKFY